MIGQVLLHYRITGKLGQGGMGVVYKAEDLKLKRTVAMKFLSPDFSGKPEAKGRFLIEARAASALNHPNICTIHAVEEVPGLPEGSSLAASSEGSHSRTAPLEPASDDSPTLPLPQGTTSPLRSPVQEGTSFIVMEYVKGTPLSVRILREGPLAAAACIDVAFQIAQGLLEAHAHGIIHRDIKPSNIIVTETGLVKIMDFGLATMEGDDPETDSGGTMGTLAYMSPEQILRRTVDHRTDIYSLGVLLYETVTGKKPFGSKDRSGLLFAVAYDDPLSPSEVAADAPRGLERVLMRCLKKDPDRRYPTCRELLADLEALRTQAAEAVLERAPGDDDSSGRRRESERRQATVMFGEIRPRGRGVDVLESSDVTYAVDDVMRRLGAIAARHGGTVDRVLGGDFTVLFGLNAAAEHSPLLALQAALAIRSAVATANAKPVSGARLAVRIGINTGPVLAVSAGGSGAPKYSVLGDTVVLASRLKDRALDGQICVGSSTHRQASKDFEFAALSPISLPGRKDALPAFEFLRERERKSGAAGAVAAQMVGRERELDLVERRVRALLEGTGGIVNVVGEAGIGKSRLLVELFRREAGQKVTVLEGRALSTGKNLPYHPIIELLKSWAGIREGDAKPDALRKLESAVKRADSEGFAEMLPFVATLMGMSLTGVYADRLKGIEGEALGRLILKGLRELLEKASQESPLLVLVEDLHWADLSSIELLEGLMRSARQHRILFLNTFRPNYPETSDRIQETIRDRYPSLLTEILLKPLDPKESRFLIQSLLDLPGLPQTLLERIIARADGNPLFIEEVIRSLIDEGAVAAGDAGFHLTERIESVVIPDTIQELLMTRLELLDETTRSVLKVAAVIGRHFFLRVLAIVAPSAETLEKQLTHLVGIQLLSKSERLGEVEYLFKHALVQEAAYKCILPSKRKELHLQVAEAIETVFADRLNEFCGLLAFHFSNGENPQKAEDYLLLAGEEAVKAAAPSEALFYFQEALNLYLSRFGTTGDPERKARLERSIGLAFHNKGRMIEAVTHFDRALDYWNAAPPKGTLRQVARLAADMGNILIRLYVTKRNPTRLPTARDNGIIEVMQKKGTALVAFDARRYFLESVGVMRRMNGFDLTHVTNGPAFYAATSALFSVPAISFPISRRILDYAKPFVNAGDPRTLLYYRFAELLHNLLIGNWTNTEPYDESLVDANRKLGEVWFISVYTLCFGLLDAERGRYAKADEYADRLEEMGDVYENDLIRARMELLRTRLLLKQRMLGPAAAAAERGIALFSKVDQVLLLIYMYGLKAQVHVLSGDDLAARETLAHVERLSPTRRHVPPYYASSYDLARLRLALWAWEGARKSSDPRTAGLAAPCLEAARRAVATAKHNAMDRTEILRLAAIASWMAGRGEEAKTRLARSLSEGERLGAVPEVEKSREELERLGVRPREPALPRQFG